MGYQTEFLVLNDAVDQIKKYPQEFANKIYDACIGGDALRNKYKATGYFPDTYSMSLGSYANPIVASKPEHADVTKVYIAGKNNMINVSSSRWSKQYQQMATNFPEILNDHIRELEETLYDLKKLRKNNTTN